MRQVLRIVLLSVLLTSIGRSLAAQVDAPQALARAVKAPQVHARVALVRWELSQIRVEMGRPENDQREIGVTEAAPREVYFQALTMFRKTDRLCFELMREREKPSAAPVAKMGMGEVLAVVNAVLTRLQRLKERLGIDEKSPAFPEAADRTPTDVFRSIVQANRQLNLLLDRRFAPSDVFERLTFAVSYGSILLDRFPGTRGLPETPAFERGKRPADVYRRLVSCFGRIQRLAKRSGLQILKLDVGSADVDAVTPSDVYDIASLLVSELDFLHSHLPGVPPPRKTYYPGRKFPSHVFQRAGVLEAQLADLGARVEKDPGWLRGKEDR